MRAGPKVSYCLRDLQPHPARAGDARRDGSVYPACSTNSGQRRVTLGTSVGWSDIYPPSYPEQWIDVTGLRGCFAYRHIADPRNGIYESNETQQLRRRSTVRLPFTAGPQRCPGVRSPAPGPAPRDPTPAYYVARSTSDRLSAGCVPFGAFHMAKTLVVAEKPSVARDLAARCRDPSRRPRTRPASRATTT